MHKSNSQKKPHKLFFIPNICAGGLFLIYLLVNAIFLLRFSSSFDKPLDIWVIVLFLVAFLISLANLYNAYNLSHSSKRPSFVGVFIFLLPLISLFVAAFFPFGVPYPNFHFSSKCEAMNRQPFTLQSVHSLDGYCVRRSLYITSKCNEQDMQNSVVYVNEINRLGSDFSCIVASSSDKKSSVAKIHYDSGW